MNPVRADVSLKARTAESGLRDTMQSNLDYPYDERITGYPNPAMYNQYFINNYSLPKGLHCTYKDRSGQPPRKSLYDLQQPKYRQGVSGWKLTRRANFD